MGKLSQLMSELVGPCLSGSRNILHCHSFCPNWSDHASQKAETSYTATASVRIGRTMPLRKLKHLTLPQPLSELVGPCLSESWNIVHCHSLCPNRSDHASQKAGTSYTATAADTSPCGD
ncbi:hypothetical protein ElyMa_006403500 [Elysia marginata]|uniref:Uncharacterized protein n=1 Tax=Elysia marginata TaxID=1093978 RepID=A0AAV4HSG4_9GAST|nr:hypothetical protein ElyMa_006403500 [Elysia marginata]